MKIPKWHITTLWCKFVLAHTLIIRMLCFFWRKLHTARWFKIALNAYYLIFRRYYILQSLEWFTFYLQSHPLYTFQATMLVECTGTILQTICRLITSTNPSIIEAILFILPWTLYVLPGTQACWQLVWGFYSFYWLAFVTQEPLKLKMSLNTSLLILMTISYI